MAIPVNPKIKNIVTVYIHIHKLQSTVTEALASYIYGTNFDRQACIDKFYSLKLSYGNCLYDLILQFLIIIPSHCIHRH